MASGSAFASGLAAGFAFCSDSFGAAGGASTTSASSISARFGGAGGWLDAPIYQRDALAPGFIADGPAVIEEYGSTTVIWPNDKFEIGELREIRIHCTAK